MIECPNCNKENPHTNVFCIYCGSRISPAGTDKDEIAGIRRILSDLNQRINVLEGKTVSGVEESTPLTREVPDPEGVATISSSDEAIDNLKVDSSAGNIFSSYFRQYWQGDVESIIGRKFVKMSSQI